MRYVKGLDAESLHRLTRGLGTRTRLKGTAERWDVFSGLGAQWVLMTL